ncbi:MAG: transporter permease [Paenibacillus sp.]|nr:transporter permease [Paenibacillus sp.]
MKIKRSAGELAFDIINPIILLSFCAIVVLPIMHVVAGAISSANALIHGKVLFWPHDLTMYNINAVMDDKLFWTALKNSVIVLVLGVTVNMVLTVVTAFPLSKSYLPYRKFILLFIIFTMIFQAPMIPVFILIKTLGLLNSLWSMIIPSAISAFNLILCITFLRSIPEELYEAARMDGMREDRMLWSIALPLSKPILVTLLLFYSVGLWNSYMAPLLYITDKDMQPLQVYLYRVVAQSDVSAMKNSSPVDQALNMNPESIQMAAVLLATLPIVIVYPFLQKHFIKGAMLGSIKE